MAHWTKRAAIERMDRNLVLQQALRLEPRLEAIIAAATSQRRAKGYHRVRRYVELRNQAIPLVGAMAENPALNKAEYFEAVVHTLDDLLPPDGTDIYPDGKPQGCRDIDRGS